MDNVTLFAGVDYHQSQVQLCVIGTDGRVRLNRAIAAEPQAVAGTLRECGGPVTSVSLEACCGSAAFGEALAGLGEWRVELAHAGYVSRLKGSPDKTDFSDARLLADLNRVGYLPRVWLAPPAVRDLRQLVGHRTRLVEHRRATKLQIRALLREQRVKIRGVSDVESNDQTLLSAWSKAWVEALRDNTDLSKQGRWVVNDLLDELKHTSDKIVKVEARLREVTDADPLLAKLLKIEGVGEVTAWMLMAYIGRFDRFKTGKQLSRYCGLSPRNVSSGSKQSDAGLIDATNKSLRAVLIQAGHRLSRLDKRWSVLAKRMLAKGKPKPVVIAAVANRWIRSMHHRVLEKEPTVITTTT